MLRLGDGIIVFGHDTQRYGEMCGRSSESEEVGNTPARQIIP